MKKNRSKKGFTLPEMLIAVFLLGLVSLMAAVMTSAVLNTTVTMQEVAQAQMLGTEALENLQSELRFGSEIQIMDEENGSNSVLYSRGGVGEGTGTECLIYLNNDNRIAIRAMGEENLLFAGTTYGRNLRITGLTFEKESGSDDSIKITVSVSYGNNVLYSDSVTVKPLNVSV